MNTDLLDQFTDDVQGLSPPVREFSYGVSLLTVGISVFLFHLNSKNKKSNMGLTCCRICEFKY